MIIRDEIRKKFIRESIFGRLLSSVPEQQEVTEILVFGCGISRFPKVLKMWYPEANVTAYDIDFSKIQQVRQTSCEKGGENVEYVSQRPSSLFKLVLADHVFHHGPKKLIEDAVRLVRPNGLIGVIDYDMVGLNQNDFFSRWGFIDYEKIELDKIGRDEAYRVHTRFGLRECHDLMRQNGIKHISSRGSFESELYKGAQDGLPPIDFYYVGEKILGFSQN